MSIRRTTKAIITTVMQKTATATRLLVASV
jgi:hypothetical protein